MSGVAAIREPLTDRELQVLGLLAQGLGTRETARRLSIAHPTVRAHVANIRAKLGASSIAHAVYLVRDQLP